MFIGHYALAFGAKRYAPTVSLGTLVLACQFADLLWPALVVLGIAICRSRNTPWRAPTWLAGIIGALFGHPTPWTPVAGRMPR